MFSSSSEATAPIRYETQVMEWGSRIFLEGMMRNYLIVGTIVILSAGIAAGQAQRSASCDRACLEGMVNQYLSAMVAHDPSKAPFAKNAVFTEDTVKLPLKEGLWFTSTGLGDYKFYVSDLQSGQVGFVGTVKEHDKPVLMALRLKIVDRQITEAESIVARTINEKNLSNLRTAPPALSQPLPPPERVARQELVRLSNLYFDAIEKSDGSLVPWDPECYRFENGILTASPQPAKAQPAPSAARSGQQNPIPSGSTCSDGLSSGMLKTIYNIRPRRTPIVDEERGTTWGMYCFNHRGVLNVQLRDGKTVPSYAPTPETIVIAEVFKIKKGRIRDIVAIGTRVPFGLGDGWAGPLFK